RGDQRATRDAQPRSDAAPPGHPGVRAGLDQGHGHPAAPAGLCGVHRRLRRRPDGGARSAQRRAADGGARAHDEHDEHPVARLSPANGRPIINPTQDIVLGLYYATRMRRFARGIYREEALSYDASKQELSGYLRGVFSSPEEVRMAYDNGIVELHAGIRVRITDADEEGKSRSRVVNTTVGSAEERRVGNGW